MLVEAFNLVERAFNLVERAFNLIERAFNVVERVKPKRSYIITYIYIYIYIYPVHWFVLLKASAFNHFERTDLGMNYMIS